MHLYADPFPCAEQAERINILGPVTPDQIDKYDSKYKSRQEEKAGAESGAVEEAETAGEETAAAEKTVPAESDAGETEADAAGETDVDESVKEK